MYDLVKLFYPKSISILGASTNPLRPGYDFFDTLVKSGYEGKIFPVNPKGGELFGHTFYKSIEDINDEIDVVLNLLSAENTVKTLESIKRANIHYMVVFTSGFAEMGEQGKVLQQRMIAAAKCAGIRIVGPNCMGIANTSYGINLSSVKSYPRGQIGLISQSGNVGITACHDAVKYDTGFSKLVFYGNQSDIAVHEYLEYFGQDEETKVIAMYVEGLKQGYGHKFFEVAKAVSSKKPIVLLKGGRTPNAVRAAISHSASLAGEARVFSSVLRQAGIIEIDSIEELIAVAETLYRCPLCKGKRIALVGSGGGHSILCTDAVEFEGFSVDPLSEKTKKHIREKLPDYAPIGNPVDMTGVYVDDLRLFADITELVLKDDNGYNGVINYGAYDMLTPNAAEYRDPNGISYADGLAMVGEVQRRFGKPIISYSPNAREPNDAFTAQRNSGVPTYDSISLATKCMKALYKRYQILKQMETYEITNSKRTKIGEMTNSKRTKAGEALLNIGKTRNMRNLTEPEVLDFLRENKVQTAEYRIANSETELLELAEELGYPLVMKIVSPDIIHKSDVGGVAVDLRNAEEVKKAYFDMMDSIAKKAHGAELTGVLLAPFVSSGIEVIAGIVKDPFFGSMLMVGSGGIFTEYLSDVAFLSLPASIREIDAALKELKIYRLLGGVRGKKPANTALLKDLLIKIGQIAVAYPEIKELDLNPIFVLPERIVIGDGRMVINE